uniref:Uncharacterized protein n=1 Tax=Candidatus Kentrum sp. DK TaxID=2126562 RepID=A0A450SG48_9GAMM|nr:MAG: hypothetical protein BECKDK2373B_GA0170837_103515 [Candidatus Kentron sp. DK]VFJ53796.1 MAG: hypothetical protein BECKDK2373C_GA0170839_104035 [Candidatus Kentron sp. DK]
MALYAKLTLRSLTALKMASKCSATKCKLRFLDHFCLVMNHNSSFAVASMGKRYPLSDDSGANIKRFPPPYKNRKYRKTTLSSKKNLRAIFVIIRHSKTMKQHIHGAINTWQK